MKWIKRLFISSSLAGVLSQILVIAVFATVFSATITITNTSATNYTYLPLSLTVNNDNLATQGYISSAGTDVQLYQSPPLLKRMLVDDRTLFVLPTLSAYGTASVDCTTNNTVEDFDIISGYGGYVTVPDNAALELSSNFSIEANNAYIDTTAGSNKIIVYKPEAIVSSVDTTTTGTINTRIASANSLDFEHSNSDYTEIPDADNLTFNIAGADTVMSITFWVKPEASAQNQAIVAKWDNAGANKEYMILMNSTGTFTCYLATSTGNYISIDSSNSIPDGVWTYVAFTYDGSELHTGMKIYYNGVITATTSGLTGTYTGMPNTAANLRLGDDLSGLCLDGVLSNVKIYQLNLSAAQVAQDYSITYTTFSNLTAYYKLIDGVGNPTDSSGNGHNATANTADWITTGGKAYNTPVSATGITSGEYDFKAGLETPFLWQGFSSTSLAPIVDGLIFNAPLPQSECSSTPFTSIDSTGSTCNVTGASWVENQGYFYDTTDVITHPVSLSSSTDFTINVWVKATAPSAGKTSSIATFLTSSLRGIGIDLSATGKAYFAMREAGGTLSLISCTSSIAGAWHMLTATYDTDTNTMYLYQDGVYVGTASGQVVLSTTAQAIGGASVVSGTGEYFGGYIGEVQVYEETFSAADALQQFNATKHLYTGTGDTYVYSTLTTVPDSTADWTILNGTTVPYCGSFTIDVNGVQQLYFAPNTIIIGTTLPDREATGGVNNGTFTWGTNPASISVEIGRLTFSSTYTSGTSITSPDVVGVVGDGIGSITRPNSDLVMPGNEFYPSVNTIATLSNIPIVMIWWFISFIFALLTLGVVRKYSNSIFAGGLMAVIIMALFCVFGTSATDPNTGGCLEWWQPAVVLIAVITQMVTDRTYSM